MDGQVCDRGGRTLFLRRSPGDVANRTIRLNDGGHEVSRISTAMRTGRSRLIAIICP
jgi:hypothetical protein